MIVAVAARIDPVRGVTVTVPVVIAIDRTTFGLVVCRTRVGVLVAVIAVIPVVDTAIGRIFARRYIDAVLAVTVSVVILIRTPKIAVIGIGVAIRVAIGITV